MTSCSIDRILNFLLEQTGITLPESNHSPVKKYLEQKCYEKKITQSEFLYILKSDPKEYRELLDIATVNETYFFREEKHFKFIEEELLPVWIQNETSVNVWSASCSSGEEALSVFSLLKNNIPEDRLHITASDISDHMIEKFRKGIYRRTSLRNDGSGFHKYIQDISEEETREEEISIKKTDLDQIEKKVINLFNYDEESLPMMDLIFIRNTLIYMNPENKQKIIGKLVKNLKIGGILLLSSSENPHISHPSLKINKGKYCYFFQKIDPAALLPEVLAKKIISNAISEKNRRKTRINLSIKNPEKKIFETPPSETGVCRIITSKINNKFYKEQNLQDEKSAEFFLQILYFLESSLFEDAWKKLAEENIETHPASLYYFYKGFIPFQKGNSRNACQEFSKALGANPNLWPARYYLIKSCDNLNEKNKHLTRIISDIDFYITENRFDYQFLLEGFNARYFRMICSEMLKKQTIGRNTNGN